MKRRRRQARDYLWLDEGKEGVKQDDSVSDLLPEEDSPCTNIRQAENNHTG